MKLKEKRLQLTGARIPGWLLDWLQSEGDMGRKIEKALVFYYGLKPPGRNDKTCCTGADVSVFLSAEPSSQPGEI